VRPVSANTCLPVRFSSNRQQRLGRFVGGHELLGKVTEIGEGVTKVKLVSVGVGCMVDSCLKCEFCQNDEEQYCANGMTMTRNSPKTHGRVLGNPETYTHGGYSGSSVTHEHFIVKIPDGMGIQRAAPILCAGITLWDPIRYHGLVDGPKKVVGVAGLGGLGTTLRTYNIFALIFNYDLLMTC
jgi:D-arabinose 1-dehydrogenase-like Zn-dependent alcohol dehydrogenase